MYSIYKSKHLDKIKPNQQHFQIQIISYVMPYILKFLIIKLPFFFFTDIIKYHIDIAVS